jgi:serine/threonine-protein kinase HipA
MTAATAAFGLYLGDLEIGALSHDQQGWSLELLPSWFQSRSAPILGQTFLGRSLSRTRRSLVLFPFFANALPEPGPLREVLAKASGISADDDVAMLHAVGTDLPGAITLIAETSPTSAQAAQPLRFSLAGVQPKMSLRLSDVEHRRLSSPVVEGDSAWIAKFGSERYPDLPEAEFVALEWARAVGFDVPRTRLESSGAVLGVPEALAANSEYAFLCERYDRGALGARIHQEDFAQVCNVMPEDKYGGASKEINLVKLGRVVRKILGDEGLLHFLRRLVFDVAVGNGDAHLKNWSLLYVQPTVPSWAPVYDVVPTVVYIPDDKPALDWPKKAGLYSLRLDHVRQLLRKWDLLEIDVLNELRPFAQRVLDTWPSVRAHGALRERTRENWEAHVSKVRLLKDLAT